MLPMAMPCHVMSCHVMSGVFLEGLTQGSQPFLCAHLLKPVKKGPVPEGHLQALRQMGVAGFACVPIRDSASFTCQSQAAAERLCLLHARYRFRITSKCVVCLAAAWPWQLTCPARSALRFLSSIASQSLLPWDSAGK